MRREDIYIIIYSSVENLITFNYKQIILYSSFHFNTLKFLISIESIDSTILHIYYYLLHI